MRYRFFKTVARGIPMLTYLGSNTPTPGQYNFRLSKFQINQQTIHLLRLHPSSIDRSYLDTYAYFCPQGGYIDIPIHPAGIEPKYLFTPSFSGCHMAVDRIIGNKYRVYHVEGGKEDTQYNDIPKRNHGFGMVDAMEYKHYGFSPPDAMSFETENMLGAAFMKYSTQTKMWEMHYQSQYADGIPSILGTIENENGIFTNVHVCIPENLSVRKIRSKLLRYYIQKQLAATFSIAKSNKKAFVDEVNKEKKLSKTQSNSNTFNCV